MKLKSILASFLVVIMAMTLVAVNKASAYDPFDPEADFLDFEDVLSIFRKTNKEAIYIVNDTDCPVEIVKAEIADNGTLNFKQLKEAVSTFSAEMRNNSNKKVLTYQLIWSQKHPFERYVNNKVITNSINVLSPGKKQKLKFTRDKYYRDDAFYEVRISKVLFEDESIWEAPEEALVLTQDDEVKNEIDKLEEKTIDEMTKEELLEKFGNKPATGNGNAALTK